MHSPSSIARIAIHVLSLTSVNHGGFRELLVGIAIGSVYILFIGVVNSMIIGTAHVVVAPVLCIHIVLTFTDRTTSSADTIIEVNIVAVFHFIHPFLPLVTSFAFKLRRLLVVHESLSVSPCYCTNDILFTHV